MAELTWTRKEEESVPRIPKPTKYPTNIIEWLKGIADSVALTNPNTKPDSDIKADTVSIHFMNKQATIAGWDYTHNRLIYRAPFIEHNNTACTLISGNIYELLKKIPGKHHFRNNHIPVQNLRVYIRIPRIGEKLHKFQKDYETVASWMMVQMPMNCGCVTFSDAHVYAPFKKTGLADYFHKFTVWRQLQPS
jgi:hypothetical protein